jgi:hypothetical protein
VAPKKKKKNVRLAYVDSQGEGYEVGGLGCGSVEGVECGVWGVEGVKEVGRVKKKKNDRLAHVDSQGEGCQVGGMGCGGVEV